jgi:poly(A) polymerase
MAEELRGREKMSVSQSLGVAAYEVSGRQQSRISIPRRFTAPMREMLAMQPRFEVHRGRRAQKLLDHRRFRAAYDFMMLRAECEDFDKDVAKFWTDVQLQDPEQRLASFDIAGKPESKKKRRRPRRRKPASQKS